LHFFVEETGEYGEQQLTETVSVVFVFSAPGFENYMRCDSVLSNEKPTPKSPEELKGCEHQGHVVYKDVEETPKK
jgi:hypothetical protein